MTLRTLHRAKDRNRTLRTGPVRPAGHGTPRQGRPAVCLGSLAPPPPEGQPDPGAIQWPGPGGPLPVFLKTQELRMVSCFYGTEKPKSF